MLTGAGRTNLTCSGLVDSLRYSCKGMSRYRHIGNNYSRGIWWLEGDEDNLITQIRTWTTTLLISHLLKPEHFMIRHSFPITCRLHIYVLFSKHFTCYFFNVQFYVRTYKIIFHDLRVLDLRDDKRGCARTRLYCVLPCWRDVTQFSLEKVTKHVT